MLNITVDFIHFALTFRTSSENLSINKTMFNIKKLRG